MSAHPSIPPTDASLFFTLPLRILDEDNDSDSDGGDQEHHAQGIDPVSPPAVSSVPATSLHWSEQSPGPPTVYAQACSRVQGLVGSFLTPDMAAALTSLFSVTHHDLSVRIDNNGSHEFVHPLLLRVTSPDLLSDDALRDMANVINTGLVDLAAFKGGGGRARSQTATPSPSPGPSGLPPTPVSESTPGRIFLSTSRSKRISNLCGARDKNTCWLTKRRTGGECCHILPFSIKDEKAVNFWKFISLFRGEAETRALQDAISMGPDSVCGGTDILLNVWWLSEDVHKYFDKGWVAIIPQLTAEQFPYDPTTVSDYSAKVEFPFGASKAVISVVTFNERGRPRQPKLLKPGDTINFHTSDPTTMQLPHPAIFQLHAIVSRIMGMKAAAGFAVLPDEDWDVDSQDEMIDGTHDPEGNHRSVDDQHWNSRPADALPGSQDLPQEPLHFALYPDFHIAASSTHSSSLLSSPIQNPHGKQEYLNEKSRHVGAVKAEYSLRMAEMFAKMSEQLGRKVHGDKWWVGNSEGCC